MDCSLPGSSIHGIFQARILEWVAISFSKQEGKKSEVSQSCLTLCDHMNFSLPGSSIHGIFQARILEWIVISFSRGSSQPRDRTWVSCIADRRFTIWATREAKQEGKMFSMTNSWTNSLTLQFCNISHRSKSQNTSGHFKKLIWACQQLDKEMNMPANQIFWFFPDHYHVWESCDRTTPPLYTHTHTQTAKILSLKF